MLSTRFDAALVFASTLHRNQVRKGTPIPYMEHVLGVTSIVLAFGGTEDEAIAALLHDAVEDQGGQATREEIRRRFGDVVTAIVDGCTDADTLPKPPWLERKRGHLEHLRSAGPAVRLVTAADKLHNARAIVRDLRSLGDTLWPRFHGGKEGTLWYYRTVVSVLRSDPSADSLAPLVSELAEVVEEMERLAASSVPSGLPR